jgi:hypothetical protein
VDVVVALVVSGLYGTTRVRDSWPGCSRRVQIDRREECMVCSQILSSLVCPLNWNRPNLGGRVCRFT